MGDTVTGDTTPDVVVVVGNPRTGSRTGAAAALVCERLTDSAPASVIELAELGPALLGFGDPDVGRARDEVLGCDLLIVASPTYKATYTGLLKLFLEQFAAGELAGTPTIPLMLGASPAHSLAGEHTLKPVLAEIGASCPTPALYLLDSAWEDSPELAAWLDVARPILGLRP
jgi:FMN reductase